MTSGIIPSVSVWGDPREQARRVAGGGRTAVTPPMYGHDPAPHQIPTAWVEKLYQRMDALEPRLASAGRSSTRLDQFFAGMMPEGATFDPGAGDAFSRAHNRRAAPTTMMTNQTPYLPELASPDRQSYPTHRALANTHWRMFFRLDGPTGTGIETLAELITGEFDIVGEGVDGSIKRAAEDAVDACKLHAQYKHFPIEHQVVGEVCPHLFWDDSEGIWTHLAFHNPDNLEVIDSPFAFVKSPPIVRYKPDDRLRQVLSLASTSPQIAAIREAMPDELIAAIMGRQHIELSPTNFTFIPRKLFPYDVRGTSIYSRLWRDFMYEDSIYAGAIAVARRVAAPLRAALVGDHAAGWIPTPEQEQRLLELLIQAETDPGAWLVYHSALKFDLVGAQERAWKIEQTAEYLERKKLITIGLSKAFLVGETTYASTAGALTITMKRCATARAYFDAVWLTPKFFKPLAEMNKWYKPTPAEVAHRVRRSDRDRELILPKPEWRNPLDVGIDQSRLSTIQALERELGLKISDQTKAALIRVDWKEEYRQRMAEAAEKSKMLTELSQRDPQAAQIFMSSGGEGGGGGMLPGLPPAALGMGGEGDLGDMGGGMPPPGGDLGALPEGGAPPPPPAPEGAGYHGDAGEQGAPTGGLRAPIWQDGRYGAWHQAEIADLLEVLTGEKPDDEPWTRIVDDALRTQLAEDLADGWEALEERLLEEGYSPKDVRDLRTILTAEGAAITPRAASSEVRDLPQEDEADISLTGLPL